MFPAWFKRNPFKLHHFFTGLKGGAHTVGVVKGTGFNTHGAAIVAGGYEVNDVGTGGTIMFKWQSSDDDVDGNYADVAGATTAAIAAITTAGTVVELPRLEQNHKAWVRLVSTVATDTVKASAFGMATFATDSSV